MMTLGPLGFLDPWLLTGLAALPVIWWLLRFTPPAPRSVVFPPTRLLKGLEDTEQTPQHSPWWLTLLRMVLAALIIFALARPVLYPEREILAVGGGPMLIVIDNGWASASHWRERQEFIEGIIRRAERDGRTLLVAQTAGGPHSLTPLSPEQARQVAANVAPKPYAPRRQQVLEEIKRGLGEQDGLSVVWLTDGIDYGDAAAFANGLAELASKNGRLQVARTPGEWAPLALRAEILAGGELTAHILRAEGIAATGSVHALSARGDRLGESNFEIGNGALTAQAKFNLPLELRNQIARLEIAGERSAGAVYLLDARSRWRRVGIVSGEARELAQPLLSPVYYVERALAPYAEVATTNESNAATAVKTLLERDLSVLILADIGKLVGGSFEDIQAWVEKGGTLIRFSGSRLEQSGDQLLPISLRQGGRTLGGSLSWSTPQPLAPFEESSPFVGLVPPQEVTIRRQVLADPSAREEAEVWARLKDGTPLVSAAKRGQGWIILFHVTANSDWSNLPMSGLFVQMLRRIVDRSIVTSAASTAPGGSPAPAATPKETSPTTGVLSPLQVLDGFGQFVSPTAAVSPLKPEEIETKVPGPEHPPGYYGPAGAARALNAIGAKTVLKPLPPLPRTASVLDYGAESAIDIKPWLLAAACVVFLADMLAIILLSTGLRLLTPARRAAAIVLALIVLGLAADPASAQGRRPSAEEFAMESALRLRLAYVMTGDAQVDQISQQGLSGLGKVLRARTAVEPVEPVGLDVARDELAFFPLLYWPVLPSAQPLPDDTLAKIDAYMKQGGLIVFDTRDFQTSFPGGNQGPGTTALSRLIGKLDIPALEPVPENHVLTKSFYLLRSFPGRFDGGAMWVEAEPATEQEKSDRMRRSDGVTSIIITSNELAGAWALDQNNQPMLPVVPGGDVQREMAFRVGVNIVIYAMTGNYKADQVHIPALLERLGQ